MSVRTRTALPLALAAGLVVTALPVRAQSASLAAAPVSAPAAPSSIVAAGPSADAAIVGVRHQVATDAPAPARRGGSAPGTALMIVGGAAILVGLVIGGGAGAAIAVAGAVAGLVGLYQYLQ